MLAVTTQSPMTGPRRVNLARDLGQITDLIEQAFGSQLDAGGRATINELRSLSGLGPLLPLLAMMDDMLRGIGTGFVWEEHGDIVGNVTLFPARYPKNNPLTYVIANVAVNPGYRRRGIARQLMLTAIDAIRETGAQQIILQVDADNDGARWLYEQLGFQVNCRWHNWRRGRESHAPVRLMHAPRIVARPAAMWQTEYSAAQTMLAPHGSELGWQRPLHEQAFRQSFATTMHDILTGTSMARWIAQDHDGAWLGSIWAQTRFASSTRLTLLVPPEGKGPIDEALLNFAIRRLSAGYRSLLIEHPADDATVNAILDRYGFRTYRTLDHMRLDL